MCAFAAEKDYQTDYIFIQNYKSQDDEEHVQQFAKKQWR